MTSLEENDDSTISWSGKNPYIIQIIVHARGLMPCCKWRHVLRFIGDALMHPGLYAAWFDYIENNLPSGLTSRASRHLVEQMARHYMRCRFRAPQKMDILRRHYETFETRFPSSVLTQIHKGGVLLAELTGKSGRIYKIMLRHLLTKEGEIGVQFVDTGCDNILAEMRGTFGPDEPDGTVYWIGAIQGSLFAGGREAICAATHDLNGLRPKQAVLHATAALGTWAGARAIYAPPHENHVSYRWWRPWLTRHKILSDYDGFWREFTAERTPYGDFHFTLPLTRRKAEDVPSKRRKEWLRRYARIDAIAADTVRSLAILSGTIEAEMLPDLRLSA